MAMNDFNTGNTTQYGTKYTEFCQINFLSDENVWQQDTNSANDFEIMLVGLHYSVCYTCF